jgi:hypothetical protein
MIKITLTEDNPNKQYCRAPIQIKQDYNKYLQLAEKRNGFHRCLVGIEHC